MCIPNQKLIHLLVNITRCHLHHGKRQFATFASIPTRNWYIYWDENVSYCAPQGISVYRDIFIITLEYFINFYTLINIFSTQLWFYHTPHTHTHKHTHTHTHTHITEGSIFISELLPLKVGVCLVIWIIRNIWLSDENLPQKKRAKMKTVISNLD